MLKRHWAAAAIFVVLTVVLTNPLTFHLWNAVEDKQDALLNTWIMAWVGHAAVTDPLNLYNANIFYPHANTLAFSEALVPQGILALPLTFATDNPVLGYNLVLLGMFWLNAFSMYLLMLDWTQSRTAGWAAGTIYAFNPFNLGNLAQIQLVSLGWLPLALLFLRRLLDEKNSDQDHGRPWRDGVLFSFFLILQSLSSVYFALLAAFLVALYFALWLWANSALPRLRGFKNPNSNFAHNTVNLLRRVPGFVLSLVVVAAALTPFLIPYLSVQHDLGFRRTAEDSEPFSANIRQFSEVSPQNLVYGRFLSPNPVNYVGGYPLDNLFPGIVALLLAAWALAVARHPAKGFLLVLLISAFLLSLGPRLYLTADEPTGLGLPYRLLYDWFPPLQALRAPVRFEALIMFSLAALGGLGATVMFAGARRLIPIGIVVLTAIEYLALPAANTVAVPVDSGVPPVYRWLAKQPTGVALQLPMIGPDPQDPRHADLSNQYFTSYHWHPTPDGFSGFFAPRLGEISDEMSSFPSSRAISLMQALDVRYLIVSRDLAAFISPNVRDGGGRTAGLDRLEDFGDVLAFRVEPPFFTTEQIQSRIYLPQPAKAASPYTAYLILQNTQGWPFSVKPTDRLELQAKWAVGAFTTVSTQLPLVTEYASVVPITLNAPAAVGGTSLKLTASGGVLGPVSLNGDVQVTEEGAGEVVAPLKVGLSQPLEGEYSQGATVPVRVTWQPLGRINAYYSVSVRAEDEQGKVIATIDREPQGHTFQWKPGSLVEDQFDLRLPGNAKPGQYKIVLLMYGDKGDTSVLLLDENYSPQETTVLGSFQVK